MMESIAAPDGASYDAYIAGEAGGKRPALVLFTPIFGIDADLVAIAEEWAAAGFLVGVPDYFFRVAPGPLERSEEGRKQGFARWEKLDVGRAIEDTRPLVARLTGSKVCNGRWGALGYCAGGELAFLAATRLGAEAIAGFHATRVHRHAGEARNARGAVSLHYGDADPLVPMSEVAAVQAALAGQPRAEVHVYESAQHGFSFKGRPSFHEVAATRSRKRAQEIMEALR